MHAQTSACGQVYTYVKRTYTGELRGGGSKQWRPLPTPRPCAPSADGQQVTISGLDPTKQYTAAVVAICNDECVSNTVLQGGQSIAYAPLVVPPFGPSPSAKPSQGPSNGGGGGGSSSSNAGAIAGGVIGGLVGVALLGGLGFFAFRNWDTVKGWVPSLPSFGGAGKGGGADAYYSTTKVGDGDAAASFLAYEPPSTGTGDGINDGVGAAYAAM